MSHQTLPAEEPELEEDVVPRGTDVNLAVAALAAAGPVLVFFLLLRMPPLRGTRAFSLFCERGLVQYFTVYAFVWGIAILLLKVGRVRREYAALGADILPLEEGQLIRQEDALQYIRRIKRLPTRDRTLLLTSRVWRALTRFKLLGSAEKVDDVLKYQGEIDADNVESSYSFAKFLIAVIPILGFLGTVLGISESVGGFSAIIRAADSIETIKEALSKVTIGLAVAFDTTLVALVMSAILMFGLTILQRIEDGLLARMDRYCMENLLDRLWVPPLHEQIEAAMVRSMSSLPPRLAAELRRHTDS